MLSFSISLDSIHYYVYLNLKINLITKFIKENKKLKKYYKNKLFIYICRIQTYKYFNGKI